MVIGASAGGLEALRLVVPSLPLEGAVYALVAVHLSPTHRSLLSELLGRDTAAPVTDLSEGLQPEAGHVYVVPPACQPSFVDGRFHLTPSTMPGVPKPSVDALMQSMAEALGDRLIAVILSGTGSDGSRGVRAVRAHGGLVLAQDPADARYDSMPLHAIETRTVHHIAPAAALGGVIRQILSPETRDDGLLLPAVAIGIDTLVQNVRAATGFDLGAYKPSTLERRVARRLRARACASMAEYLSLLEEDASEAQSLVQELLISVTSFFRDPAEFEALSEPLSQRLARASAEGREFRAWVAGCATGEEAYSLALLIHHLTREMPEPPRVRIFATDIDTEALELARRGVYPSEALQEVPQQWRSEHLELSADTLRVRAPLREMVIFSQHNLLRDPPFLRLDLLSCRNVLIYLQTDWQRWLMRHFQRALGDCGLLVLGRAETPCADTRLSHQQVVPQASVYCLSDTGSQDEPPSPALSEATRVNPPRRSMLRQAPDLGRVLLAAHSAGILAPGWVMTDQGQLQHTFGDVSAWLQLNNGGPATVEVPRLCDQRLWLNLRSLVFQARQQPGRPVSGWHPRADGQPARFMVVCIPQQPLCVVLFDSMLRAAELPPSAEQAEAAQLEFQPGGTQHELAHLREHVTATQQHLETLVSELDAANEELQMLNQELQSSNEELQSTNEELATSNEELQSTNEELITVNEELQMRTTELALRNADLDNVRNSLLDPLLVIDEHGRILLRNAAAEALWNFDTVGGRPAERPALASIPCRIDASALLTATRQVMERGAVVDLEIQGPEDRVHAARVQPYLGRQGECCGAVAVLRDITQTAQLQRTLAGTIDELQRSEALRRATVDALPDLICVLDDHGVITGVNLAWQQQAARNLRLAPEAQLGTGANYIDVCMRAAVSGDESARAILQGLQEVQLRRQPSFELTYPGHHEQQPRWHRITITPLQGTSRGVVLRHQDITQMQDLLLRLQLQSRALDAGPNGIVICDAQQPGRPVIYVNQAFESLTGYSAAEVIGRTCAILHGNDRQQAGLASLRQALAANRPTRVLLRNYRRNGELFWNELSITPIASDAGEITHWLGVQRDMTALLASEEALRASQQREAQALAFAGLGTLDWRLRDGRMLLSRQQARLFGLGESTTEVQWSELRERVYPEDLPVVEDAVKVCVAGHAALDIELRLRVGDEGACWLHLQGDVERDEHGVATHLMAICQDVTARRAAEEHAAHLSQHDGLTGLPNRSLLRDRLQRAVLQAVRDRNRMALLFIDLDRFKEVNDSLGHEAGDELLRLVAKRLQQAVRDSDTIARLGGDEFVVLLPQLHSADEARRVADKLLVAMQSPFPLRETQVVVSASIGVSLYPDDGQDGDELMRHADSAMYRAKGSGRDAVCFFSRDAESAVQLSLANRTGLRRALSCDELVLYFQPQMDLASGQLCGMEALLRWQHPERGLLEPGAFLSALDDPSLASSVGDWVIQAACRQIAEWQGTPLAEVPLAVNVSPLHLRGSALVRTLNEMLGKTGIRPDRLEIEVTEHALVDSHLGASDTLRDCRQLGIGIALDDFGTGFSSLSVLHQHPISRIKIDQSFCRRLPEDPKALAIVRAMIDMARNLSVGVVAEGIETEEQASCLVEAGCHQVQGFLYAPPAPAAATEAWCRRRQTTLQ